MLEDSGYVVAARVVPMDAAAATAIVLIGCAAGAPFLPKLAQLSKGDPALAVGAMRRKKREGGAMSAQLLDSMIGFLWFPEVCFETF